MPEAALASAGLEVATAGPMVLKPALELPGQVSLNQDRVAQVVPRLAGTLCVPCGRRTAVKAASSGHRRFHA